MSSERVWSRWITPQNGPVVCKNKHNRSASMIRRSSTVLCMRVAYSSRQQLSCTPSTPVAELQQSARHTQRRLCLSIYSGIYRCTKPRHHIWAYSAYITTFKNTPMKSVRISPVLLVAAAACIAFISFTPGDGPATTEVHLLSSVVESIVPNGVGRSRNIIISALEQRNYQDFTSVRSAENNTRNKEGSSIRPRRNPRQKFRGNQAAELLQYRWHPLPKHRRQQITEASWLHRRSVTR